MAEYGYAECRLCCLSLMLSFTYKPLVLSVVMLNVVMLSFFMLNVIMLNVDMLNVIMLNVMLNVVMLSFIMLNVVMVSVVASCLPCFVVVETCDVTLKIRYLNPSTHLCPTFYFMYHLCTSPF